MLIVGLLALAEARAQTIVYVDDDNCPGPGSGTSLDPLQPPPDLRKLEYFGHGFALSVEWERCVPAQT